MPEPPAAPRIPDLHKSAFWIYGVTAMVMREPLSITLRHAAQAGWGDAGVQNELLRTLVVLMLMSRQFLSAGIYFDQVYLQPEAARRYPKRSYPMDFLFGMAELLLAVAASTMVGVPTRHFDALAGLILLWDGLWLVTARVMGHSTAARIAESAKFSGIAFVNGAAVYALTGPVPAGAAVLLLVAIRMVQLIRNYDKTA